MSPQPAPRRAGRARAVLAGVLGVLCGLALTEAAFYLRDGGAFPLVNVYASDELRGVRLRRGSATVVGGRGERVTHVRVNRDGYRGPAWPAPSDDEVIVVGDSLSFGLGVEEDEAIAARLRAGLRGGPAVIDASVPTYGPPEYLITLEQLLAERRPAAVVLVINLLNDFAEVDRPNVARHAALDGWAVRVPMGEPSPASSPLREAVIQRSHAAFALWRWRREATTALASPEGDVSALIAIAVARDRAAVAATDVQREAERRSARSWRPYPGERPEEELVYRLIRKHAQSIARAGLWARAWDGYLAEEPPGIRPVELVGCGWNPAREQRRLLTRRAHDGMREALRRLPATIPLAPEAAGEIVDAFARADAARIEERSPRPPLTPPPAPPPLPMESVIQRAHALAEAAHARLVVVTVPLGAQISPEARAQHGLTEAESASLDRVVLDLAARARALGAVGVDPSYALRHAAAPAYLPDGHLTASGHEAVAGAVAEAMDAPRDGG